MPEAPIVTEVGDWLAQWPPITEAQREYARLADDSFCESCGKRGVFGRYCSTCEGA